MICGDYKHVATEFLDLCSLVEARPDAAFLGRLSHEFARLPYENFTKILRAAEFDGERRIRTPDIVFSDHLELGTGGTCFSLTYFFKQVLESLGFDAYAVLCDRSYGPDTHCALVVRMGGKKYLVDPGYLIEDPIEVMDAGSSMQRGPQGMLKLERLGRSNQLLLISEQDRTRKIRYRMRDVPVSDEMFLARWTDSFKWPMMHRLCASRQTRKGQLYMRDGRLRLVGEGSKNQVTLHSDFAAEIERIFGIDRRVVSLSNDALKGLR